MTYNNKNLTKLKETIPHAAVTRPISGNMKETKSSSGFFSYFKNQYYNLTYQAKSTSTEELR